LKSVVDGKPVPPRQRGKLRIRAIRDFVVIIPDQPLTTKSGMLVIPQNAIDQANPLRGTVVSVGCGLVESGQIVPLRLKPGDKVRMPQHSGTLIKDDPEVEDCFVVRENQIFGVAE
jgi:co-chaperonin GroES (HSP10)